MNKLNLPNYQFKTKLVDGSVYIFDRIRRKYYVLTPEEWVRQNFVQHLIEHYKYSPSLIAIEKHIKIGSVKKRVDIAVYNSAMKIEVLVECKASSVELNQQSFDQIARYNINLNANYLVLTNGIMHVFAILDKKNEKFVFLEDLPKAK